MKDVSTNNLQSEGDLSGITTYQAGIMQATAHRLLQKKCDTVLKQYGITKMHWLIIGSVLDGGAKGVRITDLSQQLGTTVSYIAGEVKLLEQRGTLSREDNDADSRSKIILINPSFVPKCEDIESTLRDALRKSVYETISPLDLRTYMRVIHSLANSSE